MTQTGSSKAELVGEIEAFLHASQVAIREVNVSSQGQKRDKIAHSGLEIFKKAAETKDPHIIVAVEKAFDQTELDQFADSPDMRNSLRQGIRDLEIIETYLGYIKDPAKYKIINEACMRNKNRIGNLPNDEARQCLRSHAARLKNLDTSRMDKPERDILEQRRKNIKIAEDVYITLQKTALDIED